MKLIGPKVPVKIPASLPVKTPIVTCDKETFTIMDVNTLMKKHFRRKKYG